jgi:phage recombination protein Bet
MSSDIVLHKPAEDRNLNAEQIDLIKRTICKDSTDEELQLFILQCQRTGLDPFAKQIHALKRNVKGSDGKWTQALSIQIGIDGFRLIADRTERYVPGKEPKFTYDAEGRLISATSYVKVWRRDGWHEVAATALYEEYVQTTGENKTPVSMWQKMPHSQLAKCAESLALRKAFPAELSGLYTSDEMGQADNLPTLPALQTVQTDAGTVDTATGEVTETSKPAEKTPGHIKQEFAQRCTRLGYAGSKQTLVKAILIKDADAVLDIHDYKACLIQRDDVWQAVIDALTAPVEETPEPEGTASEILNVAPAPPAGSVPGAFAQ